jgi:hypothetical protein
VKQLVVFCEGRTEQGFCTQVLQPHLFPQGTGLVHTLAVGRQDHHHIYGIGRRTKYEKVRRFIFNTLKQREGSDVYFTTLFDLYGLPRDFPGKADNTRNPQNPTKYVVALEEAFGNDIGHRQFIPYLQLHEFETILFADPNAFAISFENCETEISQLQGIANSFASIELIDDGISTAPSKRIIGLIPEYDGRKASAGPDVAEYIGLPTIRLKCPHFDSWLSCVEQSLAEQA